MSAMLAIRWDGYEFAEEADRRFRRLLLGVALPFLLLAVLSLVYSTSGQKEGGGTYLAPATVELLPAPEAVKAEVIEEPAPAEEDSKEQPQEAAPKVAEKPVETKKPAVEPTPTPVETARDVAKRSGVLAFADQLSEMRNKGDAVSSDNLSPNVLSSRGAASNAGSASGGGSEAAALAAESSGSSGICGVGTAGVSRSQSGQGLGKRRTTTIDSPVGFGRDTTKAGESGNKRSGGRTEGEIQLVFDRAQGAFYAMYIRALREDPTLEGKVVIKVTIAPDGSVTDCEIVASELGNPDLENKIIQRVKLLNFGPKDVPSFTYPNYPIKFKRPL